MLAIGLLALTCASFVLFVCTGSAAPLLLSGAEILMFAGAIGLAWARFARHILPTSALLSIPSYMTRKLFLYARLLRRRGPLEWIRTERDSSSKRLP